MRFASCPRCGEPRPAFDGHVVKCQRCRQTTPVARAAGFLRKVEELWPGETEVFFRPRRIKKLIEDHDEYLKKRGDYDITTATLDENFAASAEETIEYDAE
jgi:hypothetical protein